MDEMDGRTNERTYERVKKLEAISSENIINLEQRRCKIGAVGAENGLQKLIS